MHALIVGWGMGLFKININGLKMIRHLFFKIIFLGLSLIN